jgi:multidrug resistance efflux pump
MPPTYGLDVPMPGRVAAVLVSEGQQVRQGEPLLQLDDEAARLRVREAQTLLAAAQLEKEAAQQEQNTWPQRLAAQRAAVEAARERYQAAQQLRDEKLKASKFQVVGNIDVLLAESEVRQSQRLWEAEQARWREMHMVDPSVKVRLAAVRCQNAEVAVQQAQKAVSDCVLRAPSDGVVLRLHVHKGETLVPGQMQPPILFRPAGPLVVRAELEQEFVGRVRPGMYATIQDDARVDSPTWYGRVVQLAGWISRKRHSLTEPGQWNEARIAECLISIEGDASGLLIGQRMRVRLSDAPPAPR